MRIPKKTILSYFPLLIILLVAAALRFYRFTERISMGMDSARDAFVSLEGAKMLQFPTTGPFISIAPVTTGPWYWIQLVLARLFLPTAYAPWLLVGIYSLSLVLVMFGIGTLLGGKRLGYLSALIASISPNGIATATELTNPSVIAFYTGLVVLIFILLIKKGPQRKLGLLWGILLGITVNTHYQSLGLLTLPISLLVFRKKYLKTLRDAAIGFCLTFLPLVWFELQNHWFNTRHMIQYILVDQYKIWTPIRWLTYVRDFWPEFLAFILGGPPWFGAVILICITAVFTLQLARKKLPLIYVLLGISFLLQVVNIRYYRGEKFFGYLQFFVPYVILFTAYVLNRAFSLRFGKILGIIFVTVFLFFAVPSSLTKLSPSDFTVQMKTLSSDAKAAFGPGPYKLYTCKDARLWEIPGIVLQWNIEGAYSSSGKPLLYFWGCGLPRIRLDGSYITDEELKKPETIFPSMGYLYDISIASPAALPEYRLQESSPNSMYQSAARWWLDEQP